MSRWPWIVTLACLVVYLSISLNHLAVFPAVGQDEPWIAAAPYKLATQGVYGSDLFAGYYGAERHDYDHMPLYPLLQAAMFKMFGAGVFQMRLLPVSLGLVLLLLVLCVGCQLGSARIGALAIVLLIGLRLAAGDAATGILLLDGARINRYDIAVPVFGLMSLLAFNRAERLNSNVWFAASGSLAGLAGLSHVYGAFWLPVFILVLFVRRGWSFARQAAPWLMLAGFSCMWAPWIAYIAMGWSDYLGQMRYAADRFQIFRPSFYISNVVHEVDRYRAIGILDSSKRLLVARPGTWTVLLGLPAALAVMLWQTRLRASGAVFTIATAAIVQAVMFACLLKMKTYGYAIALWPLAALSLAWLGIWLWDRKNAMTVRVALLTLLMLILTEGTLRIAHSWNVAEHTTPYEEFTGKVAKCIPAGSLVLGLQHYWMGLRQYPYRTWLVPMAYTHAPYYHERLTMDQALERVHPDVILIDRYIRDYFERITAADHPDHEFSRELSTFMARHGAELTCVVEDKTYGSMRIYLLKRPQLGSAARRPGFVDQVDWHDVSARSCAPILDPLAEITHRAAPGAGRPASRAAPGCSTPATPRQ